MPEQTRPAGPKAQNADYIDGIDSTAFELLANKNATSGYVGLDSAKTLAGAAANLATSADTSNATLGVSSNSVRIANATSGVIAYTVPTAVSQRGKFFFILKSDSSSNAVTITRTGSDTIAGATSISLAQQYQYVALVSDGTSVWHVVAMGVASTNGALKVPTLSGDPASPATGELWYDGSNLKARKVATESVICSGNKNSNGGYVGNSVDSRTGAVTLTSTSSLVQKCDATSGAYAVTLPAANAVASGRFFIIKKIDSSGNAVTVTRAGSDTIDGATTYALSAQYQSVTLYSDGSALWLVV